MFEESNTRSSNPLHIPVPPVRVAYSATLRIPGLSRMQVLAIILHELKIQGMPDERLFWIRLAIDEAIINAITHGHGEDADRPFLPVRVDYNINDTALGVRITDNGGGFNIADVADPTLDENLWNIEGRGIFLMRQAMDRVIYNTKGNSVLLIHKIESPCEKNKGDQIPPDFERPETGPVARPG